MLAIFVKIPTMLRHTEDPQFFSGFQIYCGSQSATPLPTSPLVTPILDYQRQPYWQGGVINEGRELENKYGIWTQANVNLRKIYINLENHREYRHKPYVAIARIQSHWATSSSLMVWSIFIQIFMVDSERRTWFETECVMALQGHPRSLILAPIESAYATSYRSSTVTLILSCPVSEILQVF